MAKLTINPLLAGYRSSNALNANFDAIEAALENTLSRDGTSPNQMEANLDLNDNKIVNLAAGTDAGDAVRLDQVQDVVDLYITDNIEELLTDAALASIDAREAEAIAAVEAQETASVAAAEAAVSVAGAAQVVLVDAAGANQIALIGSSASAFSGDTLPFAELIPQAQPTHSVRQPIREFNRTPGRDYIVSTIPLDVGSRRNVWQYTETLSHATYGVTNATKGTDTIVIDGITLTRLTSSNFYGQLSSNVSGLGLTPFTAGQRYLISFYSVGVNAAERFFWMRSLATGSVAGHGVKLMTNSLRRHWCLAHALTTSTLDLGADGTIALGSGSAGGLVWLFNGASAETAGALDCYVGGFQIETVEDATYKDGVAVIGDSTFEVDSGATDAQASRAITAYLAGTLNVPVFNRANGGERLDTMDARWATDITPLAASCREAIISGGINDVSQSRTLVQMQASINSMVSKAKTDFGRDPIICTCPPANQTDAAKEAVRTSYNAWIKATFPRVIDLDGFLRDPITASKIRQDAGWISTGDQTHWLVGAARAAAAWMAGQPVWDFKVPTPYQPIAVTTYTPPTAAVRHNSLQVLGGRVTGFGAMTGTATKTAIATFGASGSAVAPGATYVQSEATSVANRLQAAEVALQEASRRLKAVDDALRTHGIID